jgi:hypothetical protein
LTGGKGARQCGRAARATDKRGAGRGTAREAGDYFGVLLGERSKGSAAVGEPVQRRAEALTLIDWGRLDDDENLYSPVRIFRGPQVFDRDFYPLYRRFLTACCRELDQLLIEESSNALKVIEAFAYSRASFTELVEARNAAKVAARRIAKQKAGGSRRYAAEAVRDSARNDGFEALLVCCYKLKRAGLTDRKMAAIFQRVAAEWVTEQTDDGQ